MTDDPTVTLGEYDGRDITATTLAVRKVGGGLHDPLAIEPELIPVGETRMLCIPVVCVQHDHTAENRKEPDEGGLVRTHVFDAAGPVFFVDEALVEQARGEHQHKVMLAQKAIDDAKELAKRQAKGTGEKPVGSGQGALGVDAEALTEQHLATNPDGSGGHSGGKVAGCPECEWEDEAADLEERETLGLGAGPAGDDDGGDE